MNRQEMIDELLEDDMNGVASMSMGENDDLIRDMLLNGRRGYNNYTDEELNEEYKRYLEMQDDEEEDESSNVQYKYKTIDESGEHPEYPFGIEWSSDLEGVLIDHIKWYETEEERDRIFNESEALDALKIMEEGDE
jgi:hypothetical protein